MRASGRALRLRGSEYPVVLPSWKDPRLHLSLTFVALHTLGQVEFHFRLSIPQIITPLLTCAVIEVVYTLWKKRVILWPASALLTGNGIAFIMRIPGTQHGQWWSTRGLWVYAAVAAVSMLSKYVITFRGKHVFNPSNLGLVLCFLLLGSARSEPLQFWWGPLSPALVIVLGTIVFGAFVVLSRAGVLAVAALFWVTFASGTGILALSGHAFTANWHLGPVADGYFWKVLVTSPEVFIFLSFMITDPRTVPETSRGRRLFAVAIGLLASLLIAPMRTEFDAKVALLGTLTIVCAARPLLIVARERLARPHLPARLTRRPILGAGAALGAASFAGLLVAAGAPARSFANVAGPSGLGGVQLSIEHTPGVVSINHATGERVVVDAIGDLRLASEALARRDAATAAKAAGGAYLADLQKRIAAAAHTSIVVPSYRVQVVTLSLRHAVGQAPPTVVAVVSGTVTPITYGAGAMAPTSGASTPFTRTFDLALSGGRFLLIGSSTTKLATAAPRTLWYADAPKGTAAFSSAVKLVNVASKVGLVFHQDAFRYGMTYDPQAMMGGGVCVLDYNGDGWEDVYAVNSYADVDQPQWAARGGLPRSRLFRNEHGRFVDAGVGSGAEIRVKGTGCVAGDFNGDGRTDLLVTTATGVVLLWNDGNGRFSVGTKSAGIHAPYGWYASASVADVNGDGRPDIFIAGYTKVWDRITTSFAGFPTNYGGVRDLLYLNEGNGPDGRARFKEVGVEAGLESTNPSHGLGSVFTDVNGDGRPDLYVANDEDANDLYLDEPGGPLGFHFVNVGQSYGVADHNAGMGVAEGDYNDDGRPDLFITNSRGQPHAAYQSGAAQGETVYTPEMAKFGQALERKATVGWGDSWVDLANNGRLDLVLANGAIPVTNVKQDTEPMQVLENLGSSRFTLATGVIRAKGMPKIIGRGLAAADFGNDGRMGIVVNSIDGPLVLLENEGKVGNWLDVALKGFHPGAVVTAELPNGKTLVEELHAGSSYLSSEDPRAHFGLGTAPSVKLLTVRYPGGRVVRLRNVRADQIVAVR